MQSSNQHIRDFVREVCKEIRFKSVHVTISKELADHIEDQKNEYLDQGLDEETAISRAVEQMGDPVAVGKQLNKTHRPKVEWSILSILAVLVVVGGIVQYFLSGVDAEGGNVFARFLQYAPIGIAAFALMYFFDYTWLVRYSKTVFFVLYAITVVGFLASDKMNGSYVYMYYSSLLFIPAFAGVVYSYRNKGYLGLIYSGLCYASVAILCIMAPSFSSLVLFTISCLIILTVATVKGFFGGSKKLGLALIYVPTLLISALILIAMPILSPYRFARVSTLFSFNHDPAGAGYILAMVRKLIAAAEPMGSVVLNGYAENMSINQILPLWSTDLSLTYIIARLGYVPGVAIVFAMLMLVIRMFVSVLKQKNAYGFLVALSVCLAVTGQILFYVFSNIGVISPLSFMLPLISFGAFGFIVNMALLGLLLSVYRRTNLVPAERFFSICEKYVRKTE